MEHIWRKFALLKTETLISKAHVAHPPPTPFRGHVK